MSAEFPPKTVRLVFFDRDREACFRCHRSLKWELRGSMLDGGWSAHHRKPRGQGGSRNAALSKPSNLLILCGTGTTGCHGKVEANRALSIELGLLVSTNGVDEPVNVPVRDDFGSWWWLTNWASKQEIDDEVKF